MFTSLDRKHEDWQHIVNLVASKGQPNEEKRQTMEFGYSEIRLRRVVEGPRDPKVDPNEKDPNMKRVHSGPAQGKGAVYEWDGNREVGAGRIAITDSTPSKVTLDLEMLRPFAARNVVEFTLEPRGQGTLVTWAMRGTQPFMVKLMSTFINCEKMVCSQFDQGLAKLKTLAEA